MTAVVIDAECRPEARQDRGQRLEWSVKPNAYCAVKLLSISSLRHAAVDAVAFSGADARALFDRSQRLDTLCHQKLMVKELPTSS